MGRSKMSEPETATPAQSPVIVSENAMRPYLYILSIAFLSSCMAKPKADILIVPFERGYDMVKLDLDTLSKPIVFSDAFWQHFTATFPSATIALFSRRTDEYDNIIQLSDSAYSYGLISSRNQIFLRNHLPKNLSKEESENYWEGIGFFVLPDSPDANAQHEPEVTLERHWSKATQAVEKEYEQFMALVTDQDREYAVVAKKQVIDSILRKY